MSSKVQAIIRCPTDECVQRLLQTRMSDILNLTRIFLVSLLLVKLLGFQHFTHSFNHSIEKSTSEFFALHWNSSIDGIETSGFCLKMWSLQILLNSYFDNRESSLMWVPESDTLMNNLPRKYTLLRFSPVRLRSMRYLPAVISGSNGKASIEILSIWIYLYPS